MINDDPYVYRGIKSPWTTVLIHAIYATTITITHEVRL